jgi:hypothetical protein
VSEAAKLRTSSPEWRAAHAAKLAGRFCWENSGAFKGGTFTSWRMNVLRRDKFICQDCGIDDIAVLSAHHIEPRRKRPDLALDIANGVTLCANCHARRHYRPGRKYSHNHIKMVRE